MGIDAATKQGMRSLIGDGLRQHPSLLQSKMLLEPVSILSLMHKVHSEYKDHFEGHEAALVREVIGSFVQTEQKRANDNKTIFLSGTRSFDEQSSTEQVSTLSTTTHETSKSGWPLKSFDRGYCAGGMMGLNVFCSDNRVSTSTCLGDRETPQSKRRSACVFRVVIPTWQRK